uniref:Uncharacterized protein n=1 Tax=Myoviridae sp. ctXXl13 TaxID=2827691 RepID=A0A8S5TJT2_9CAUD|nr:MAG TPA: hypothetical protein [Myoviridae sp. ctXXl13]
MENEEKKDNILDCKHGYKTVSEICSKFDCDSICETCKHLRYNKGVISCEYSQV